MLFLLLCWTCYILCACLFTVHASLRLSIVCLHVSLSAYIYIFIFLRMSTSLSAMVTFPSVYCLSSCLSAYIYLFFCICLSLRQPWSPFRLLSVFMSICVCLFIFLRMSLSLCQPWSPYRLSIVRLPLSTQNPFQQRLSDVADPCSRLKKKI